MNKFITTLIVCLCLSMFEAMAQERLTPATDRYTVATNSFWSNWYVQGGLDMALQKPNNYDFSKVFPNGNSYGVDVAVGKWFTPGVGVRFKMNMNNRIGGLLENKKFCWVGPMNQPGANHDGGGFGAAFGDVQFDIFHYVHGYNQDRKWKLLVYPRMGCIYNFAIDTGSLIIGGGVQNLYRVSSKWSIYFDASYQMMSSGIGLDPSVSTGLGAKSNGYFDFSIGVQYDLGVNTFKKL